jgi:hypothetical protein
MNNIDDKNNSIEHKLDNGIREEIYKSIELNIETSNELNIENPIKINIETSIDSVIEPDMNNLIKLDTNKYTKEGHEFKKHHGEIYLIHCKISKKKYVGQASNFVSGNKLWGTYGRWKSHINEAFSNSKDHCAYLNNALRKYKPDNFDVYIIYRNVYYTELDNLERKCIEIYRTLYPNGYNISIGGKKNKTNIISTPRKSPSKYIKSLYKSTGQLGNRRKQKERVFPEDNELPKYIVGCRNSDKQLIGYTVKSYPIGTTNKKYITKSFTNKNNITLAFDEALKYLNYLKEKYHSIDDDINKNKETLLENKMKTKLENKYKTKLPLNIYPIIEHNKLNGYYVSGLKDPNGNEYEKMVFNKLSSNSKNLQASIRYIKHIDVLNQDIKFKEYIYTPLIKYNGYGKKDITNSIPLPNNVSYVIVNGKKIGYQINNFKLNNSLIKKKICDTHETMEIKFKKTLLFLEDLWNQKITARNNSTKTELINEN